MGNWRNRPHRRSFHRQDWTPITRHYDHPEPQDSSPNWGLVDDGMPSWEKKFCSVVGSVPWSKVVESKMFVCGNNNVLNWDDSAGEEAYHNAKKRFWAEINNLPCDISLPDPDLYIDEINWNSDVDPELMKDLERDLFIPEEEEMDNRARRRNKRLRYLLLNNLEKCKGNQGDYSRNVLDCKDDPQSSVTVKDRAQGWNQWNTNYISSNNLNNKGNPWETDAAQAVRGNARGNADDMPGGWNQSGNPMNQFEDSGNKTNPWECSWHGVEHVKNEGWGKFADGSWGNNWQQSEKLNDGTNSKESSVTLKDKAQGWNQWDSKYSNSNNLNNIGNPWELDATQAVKGGAWGDASDMPGGWNQCRNHVNWCKDSENVTDPWERTWQGIDPAKNEVWGKFNARSWGNNWQQSEKLNNGGNSWESCTTQGWRNEEDKAWGWRQWDKNGKERESTKSKEVSHGCGDWNASLQAKKLNVSGNIPQGWRNNKDNRSGWRQWNNNGKEHRNIESREVSDGWGACNGSLQKTRDGHLYMMDHKSTWFRSNGNQTDPRWRGGNSKKRAR